MKTAISIPDQVFEAAEQLARRLGISRSELYAKAVFEYINDHRYMNVTDTLNRVYGDDEEKSSLDPTSQNLQFNSLLKDEW
jgi:metal-responsive CopG/Arc/MetJ family transcriptional regulator